MQKLLTMAIDIEQLKSATRGAFTVTEVAGVNALLHEGWVIQEWKTLTTDQEEETAVLLLLLDDEMAEDEFSVSAYEQADENEESREREPNPENDEQEEELADEDDNGEDESTGKDIPLHHESFEKA